MRPGEPDMNLIIQQAEKIQRQLADARDKLAKAEVTGQAGNGLVTVTSTASGEVTTITIDPKVVDPEDVETLQDLVLGALADAARQAKDLQQQTMGPLGELAGGLGLPGLG